MNKRNALKCFIPFLLQGSVLLSQQSYNFIKVYKEPENGGSLVSLDDGGFILCGDEWVTNHVDADVIALGVDKTGAVKWMKQKGDTSDIVSLWSMQRTLDGNCIYAGNHLDKLSGKWSGYVLKSDLQGNLLWDKLIDSSPGDVSTFYVGNYHDGGYILAGDIY